MLPSSINSIFGSLASQEPACCDFINNSCNANGNNGSACSRFALMDTFPDDEHKLYWKNLPPP